MISEKLTRHVLSAMACRPSEPCIRPQTAQLTLQLDPEPAVELACGAMVNVAPLHRRRC